MTLEEINKLNNKNKKYSISEIKNYCSVCQRVVETQQGTTKCPICDTQLDTHNKYNGVTINAPLKPKFSLIYIVISIIGLLLCILSVYCFSINESNRINNINNGKGDPRIGGMILFCVGLGILIGVFVKYYSLIKDYNLYKNDYSAYKLKHKINGTINNTNTYGSIKQTIIENSSTNIPKCPTCGSTNIKIISDLRRGIHGLAWGILSNTARSQFECRNCGYKW